MCSPSLSSPICARVCLCVCVLCACLCVPVNTDANRSAVSGKRTNANPKSLHALALYAQTVKCDFSLFPSPRSSCIVLSATLSLYLNALCAHEQLIVFVFTHARTHARTAADAATSAWHSTLASHSARARQCETSAKWFVAMLAAPPPLVRLCAQPLMFLANALHLRCDVCEEPQLARDAIQ